MPALSAKNQSLTGGGPPGLGAVDSLGMGNMLEQQAEQETEEQRRRRMMLEQMQQAVNPLGAASMLAGGQGRNMGGIGGGMGGIGGRLTGPFGRYRGGA